MSANCFKKSTVDIMAVAAVEKITFLSQIKHKTGQVVTSAKETKSIFYGYFRPNSSEGRHTQQHIHIFNQQTYEKINISRSRYEEAASTLYKGIVTARSK
jgi:hypothetical protein